MTNSTFIINISKPSLLFSFLVLLLIGCKKETHTTTEFISNQIEFAENFELYEYQDYKIVRIKNVSPASTQQETYVFHKKEVLLPDSLKQYISVVVPVQSIVVTSTTHIPSLEMLGVENSLIGFPGLDYISSEKVRVLIDSGKIKEVGRNERLNTELVLDLDPEVLVSYTINQTSEILENLKNAGVKVLLNGDWNEKHALGKAEWIKFFGALFDKDEKAKEVFDTIKSDYEQAKALAQKANLKPSVITGNIYEDVWYLPKGDSWSAEFLADANTNYYWSDTSGTGSLALSFEEVFDTAQDADYWIGAGSYASLDEMLIANPHYREFKAFKEGNVYTYSTKTGAKGGVIYFELAPNRPDLVLKDIIKIAHPELLKDYELQFFEQLK
jgi:iron complex transport system substrate-binding protein